MVIGRPLTNDKCSLLINDVPLEYVNEYKYLGVVLCSGISLTFSPLATIRSFHRAANAIFFSQVKPDNNVLLKLLYSNCVPIIGFFSC